MTYLPQNAANASAVLAQLQSNLWTDRGTRLVAITFNMYNTNTKLLTVVRLTMEIFMTSKVVLNREIYSMRLVMCAWAARGVTQSRFSNARVVLRAGMMRTWTTCGS